MNSDFFSSTAWFILMKCVFIGMNYTIPTSVVFQSDPNTGGSLAWPIKITVIQSINSSCSYLDWSKDCDTTAKLWLWIHLRVILELVMVNLPPHQGSDWECKGPCTIVPLTWKMAHKSRRIIRNGPLKISKSLKKSENGPFGKNLFPITGHQYKKVAVDVNIK